MLASNATNSRSLLRKAVIPAAGLGTRLQPLTRAIPKEMLPLGRKPVLAYVVEELRQAGITDALFVVSERKLQIRAYFGESYAGEGMQDEATSSRSNDSALPPLRCAYVTQEKALGLGDALLYAQEWVGAESFVVAFGDCIIDSSTSSPDSAPLQRMMETHQRQQASATVLVETIAWENVSRYGILAPKTPSAQSQEEPFEAADIVEKPALPDSPSNLAVAARWILPSEIFAALRAAPLDPRGEINLTDSVRALCRKGRPLWAVPLLPEEFRRDIGAMDSFFAAFLRAALNDPQAGESARQAAREILNGT